MRSHLTVFVALLATTACRPGSQSDKGDSTVALRAGCDAGRAVDCRDLGVRYQDGQGVPGDLHVALSFYERGCKARDGASCHMAGQAYLVGAGAPRDPEQAIPLLRQSCELLDPHGCYKLGDVYAGGAFGPARDPRLGLDFLTKACDLGHSSGCFRAGSALEVGAAGVQPDVARAIGYYQRACGTEGAGLPSKAIESLGQASACSRLGVVPAKNRNGQATDGRAGQLMDLARDYFVKECDGGAAQDCFVLGGMYQSGEGAPKDRQKAREYFDQACSRGIARACQAAEAVGP